MIFVGDKSPLQDEEGLILYNIYIQMTNDIVIIQFKYFNRIYVSNVDI